MSTKEYSAQITGWTACELSNKLKEKEVSAYEVTEAYLDCVKQTSPKYGTYLTVTKTQALEQAQKIDEKRSRGERLSVLAGIPFALKDNICTKGIRTTCASHMLENFVPQYDAFVSKRLKDADGILLGKLNMDEFAMGSGSENSAFLPVKNPHDIQRVAGGSSGGSAAAVACNSAAFALGSDTGGSIRQPASFCGVVGLKPTYGRVSRNGLIAFASSLDQIGTLSKTVSDCAMISPYLFGYDPGDSTSVPVNDSLCLEKELDKGVKGIRVGVIEELMGEGIGQEIKEKVNQTIAQLEQAGAVVQVVSLPMLSYALPAYYLISSAEASSNLARFDGVRYGSRAKVYEGVEQLYVNTRSEYFGEEVKRRIMLGTFALSSGYYDAYYKKAQQVRQLVIQSFRDIWEQCDYLISPTAPTTPWKLGEKTSPLESYLEDVCTVPANIAGIPAISVPVGKDKQGLPIGVQIMGKAFDEKGLLQVAYSVEQLMGGNQ